MTDGESKLSAAVITALMITSVAAMTLIAAPASAQGNTLNDYARDEWHPNDPANASAEDYSFGNISLTDDNFTSVWQGEEDIDNWVNATGGNTVISGESISGVPNEGAEGATLDLDPVVPQTQQTGKYNGSTTADGNVQATVREPRVTSLEVYNAQGQKVNGEVQEDQALLIKASWNYLPAEDLSLDVTDQTGLGVEDVALTSGNDSLSSDQIDELDGTTYNTSGGWNYLGNGDQGNGSAANLTTGESAYWALDLSDLDAGAHTITVEGVDDLDFGDATASTTIDVTAEDDASLVLEQDEATQGQKVKFTIENSNAGLNHVVAIEEDDIRSGVTDPEETFEFAGDTELRHANRGNQNFQYLYAVVEIDPGSGVGVGRIDTSTLDDDSIDVTLYDENATDNASQLNNTITNGWYDFGNDIDESTLDVNEGDITIDNPGATYVPGQEIDLNGTASDGMDDVGIYVRDQGAWELLLETNVDANGDFEDEDVVLTDNTTVSISNAQDRNSSAHELLRIPDIYRFGAVDSVDADINNVPGADGTLSSSDFNSGTSSQRSLRVALPTLTATFETYDGAVYRPDDTTVTGRSIGPDTLVALFTGEKGDVIADSFGVDSDDTFDEDWNLGGETVQPSGNTHTIREGNVLGTVLSTGRDGEFGDGEFTNVGTGNNQVIAANVGNFVAGANGEHQQGKTLSQLVETFRDETIEDVGSDDLIVSERFRVVTDSGTSIEDVVPAEQSNATGLNPIEVGETAEVRGTTHLKPDDNTIVLETTNGSDANKIPVKTTDTWGFDGEWNVTMDVPTDVTPGTYTLEADDTDTTDTVSLEIVAQGERGDLDVGDTEVLRNQIDELEGQVQQLRQRNQELNSTVSDLRSENDDLQSQLDDAQTDDGTDENATETEDEGQPGFTPVVALIALISAALVALRRR